MIGSAVRALDSSTKALVLGSTGLLGQAMCGELHGRGTYLRTMARRGADLCVDITCDDALLGALKSENPDIVINCAAIADIESCEDDPLAAWKTNARPLGLLADWSRRRGRTLVHISTDHYFVDGGNTAHDEYCPITLVNEYARTKFAGEAFALSASGALVLRTSFIGIRGWDRTTLAEWAIAAVTAGRPINLYRDVHTSSIDVTTLARAAVDLIAAEARGLLNVAAREVYSKADLVGEIARQLDRTVVAAGSGTFDDAKTERARCLGLDVRRAEQLLGYRLPTLKEVVKSVLEQAGKRAGK